MPPSSLPSQASPAGSRRARIALRIAAVAGASLAAAADCTPPAPPRAVPTATATPATAPTLTATPSASAEPPPEDPPRADPPNHSDPATLACGDKRCAAAKETCCLGIRGATACVATVPLRKDQLPEQPQIDACVAALGEHARTNGDGSDYLFRRCDESLDCGATGVCCSDFVDGINFYRDSCAPAAPPGQTACNAGEPCIGDGPCRTPGASCVHGHCEKKLAKIDCGKTACSGDTPVCCDEPPSCHAAADECKTAWFHCAHPSDCLRGEVCVMLMNTMGTLCSSGSETGLPVCDHHAECSAGPCGARARCRPDLSYPHLKTCSCPEP